MIQIKHKFSGKVLFEYNGKNLKIAVEFAVSQGADLQGAYLRGADLQGADLRDANLQGADLRDAYLRDAYLRDANLQGADLQGAYLQGADLRDAYLRGADLRDANLQGADLRDAYLRDAYLRDANLQGAKIKQSEINKLSTCPKSGDFIAWKKTTTGAIVKLKIPASARRTFNLLNRKCRAEAAIVLDIEMDGKKISETKSMFEDVTAIYKVGEWVFPDSYDADCFVDCSHGIHFFMTIDEALEW